MAKIRALIVEHSSMTIATEGSRCHVIYALSASARGSLRKPFAAEQLTDHVSPILEKEP
jgi:exosome complex RNA-binding protein Csl4